MTQMIGFEFGKIFKRKIVYVAILCIILLGGAMFQGRGVEGEIAMLPDGTYIEGREAVVYDIEVASRYKGELTEEKIQNILEEFSPRTKDAAFWGINTTYNMVAGFWGENDGSWNGMGVRDIFPNYQDEKEMVWNYNTGWLSYLEMGIYTMVFMGFLLVIALSPVFSEEYTRGTDALILTARYGKRQCVWAKIIASYLFTIFVTGGYLLLMTIGYFMEFGLVGGEASVQLNNHFLFQDVPYFLSYIQAAGYCLVLWIGGSLILTAIVLLLSSLCKSSFITIIAALACYMGPNFLGQLRVPAELLSLNPIWCFFAEKTLAIPKMFAGNGAGMSYVWVVAAFAVLAVGISFGMGRRIFARHQVT
ncbi:MAG: hypothetical protein HFJ10_01400 [Lachnospiraceae bacterium]|jgi:ABC-type transport system involved in multi-copper enzyme maturation permease subunit|nr:hypothetical protein [Lachnospiraceae bacterium]